MFWTELLYKKNFLLHADGKTSHVSWWICPVPKSFKMKPLQIVGKPITSNEEFQFFLGKATGLSLQTLLKPLSKSNQKKYSAAQCIICTYFAFTRMSIRAHMCVDMHTYVSLLCIPIGFFLWSIVGPTRHIIFMRMKKASKLNFHIVKMSCWWMKAVIYRVFNHFANSLTNYHFFDTCLILSYEKRGRKLKESLEVPILTCELYVFTRKDLCFGTCWQVIWEMFI